MKKKKEVKFLQEVGQEIKHTTRSNGPLYKVVSLSVPSGSICIFLPRLPCSFASVSQANPNQMVPYYDVHINSNLGQEAFLTQKKRYYLHIS